MGRVNHLNTYRQLEEELLFYKGFLQVLESGLEVAWIFKENDEYFLESEATLSFDILASCENVKAKLGGGFYYLILYSDGHFFRGYIGFKQRVGGYEEPMQEFIFAQSKGHSLKEVLLHLNKKLDIEQVRLLDTREKVVRIDFYKRERKKVLRSYDYENLKW